jgi:DnaJ family protein C protein 16
MHKHDICSVIKLHRWTQGMFDALCPPEWAPPRKRLCVVLVSENTPYHDEPRQALREFAQEAPYSTERVRFAYIFQERQTEFVSALSNGMLIFVKCLLRVIVFQELLHCKQRCVFLLVSMV